MEADRPDQGHHSTDEEDEIPLARLKTRPTDTYEDDIPLAFLTRPGTPESGGSSFYDNSDADPDFNVGVCEVQRCQEEVWAACENCLMLVCYDHFMEDVTSCSDHGKSRKKKLAREEINKAKGLTGRKEEGNIVKERENEDRQAVKERENGDRENATREIGDGEAVVEGRRENEERERGCVTAMAHTEADREPDGVPEDTPSEMGPQKQQRGRKRIKNPDQWARNVQKRLRDTGKAHTSTTGKETSARKMGPSCGTSCTLKCSNLFHESDREKIFDSYWKLGDKREQRHYILKHVEAHPAKRKRVGSERKNVTFQYYMYSDISRVQVCRHFFLNTLDIGRDFVYGTMKMHSATGTLNPIKQGAHGNQRKIDDSLIRDVRNHISAFQTIDSHYCRANTAKKYLDSSLSVSKMYQMYKDTYHGAPVTESKYRHIFDTEFNLGFHRPKKDQCETCVAYRNKTIISEEEKDLYATHPDNTEKARELKDIAKAESKKTISKASCAFDMQQILLCPHGQSSSFYYKRRLGVFNFTIYSYKDSDGFCYMWPESEARRGPNEVSTCLFDYIKGQAARGVCDIELFSDNCGGQNRNRYTAFALWYARNYFQLKRICHTFMEKGHTETENDSIHATIERATRRIELYTPQQWFAAVRTSRASKQPYIVREMVAEDFIDFKSMALSVKNLTTDDYGERVMWSKTRQLVVSVDDPNAMFISTTYGGIQQRLDLFRRNRRSNEVATMPIPLLTGLKKPGIVAAKKADLLALCDSGQIPHSYTGYFHSLPLGESSTDDLEED